MKSNEKIILGIDPGTNVMGYGIIEVKGNSIKLISTGVVKLDKYDNHPLKLKKIFEKVISLIDQYNPDELAIEAPFFGKNVQSMLKLGKAQGVAIAAALSRDMPIFEYAPKKIKQSITGKGSASKEQVSAMILKICKVKLVPKYFDATDGLAAAVCHHFQSGSIMSEKKYTGWAAFVKENPKKLK